MLNYIYIYIIYMLCINTKDKGGGEQRRDSEILK